MASRTYRDMSVQGFSVGPHVVRSDVQHINLRAGHHDTDEGPVLGPRTLSVRHNMTLHDCYREISSCVPPQ